MTLCIHMIRFKHQRIYPACNSNKAHLQFCKYKPVAAMIHVCNKKDAQADLIFGFRGHEFASLEVKIK